MWRVCSRSPANLKNPHIFRTRPLPVCALAFHTAAVSCLKRALYLDPFEWIICYNLGLVHLNTGQYASAFHYFSASINLKSDFPASYMYLAITLARLKDFPNSCTAYEKAISMEQDHMNHLNYAITLYNHGEVDKVRLPRVRSEHPPPPHTHKHNPSGDRTGPHVTPSNVRCDQLPGKRSAGADASRNLQAVICGTESGGCGTRL